MKWSIGAKISSGFALGLAILVVLGVLSYRDTTGLIASVESVKRTYQILGKLESVINEMTDAETGERGFIITGQDTYLEPYNTAVTEVGATLKDLRQLIVRYPASRNGSTPWSRLSQPGWTPSRRRSTPGGRAVSKRRRIWSSPGRARRPRTISARRLRR